jgi:hypothetical protein
MPLVYVKKENYFILIAQQLSALWILFRALRITATGISKLMRANPYSSAEEYRDEILDVNKFDNVDKSLSGIASEPFMKKYYQKENPHIKMWDIGMCIPADREHICGSPDNFVYDPTEREGMREGIVEYKTTMKKLCKEPQTTWIYQTKSMMGMSKRQWVDIVHARINEKHEVLESWTKRIYYISYEWDNILAPESDRYYNETLLPIYKERGIKPEPLIADMEFESFDELAKVWGKFDCSLDVSTDDLKKELAKEREIWQTVGSNKHKKSPVLLPSKNTSSDTKNTKQLSTLFSSLENVKGPITMLCNNVLEYKPENNEKVSTVTCKQDNSLTYNVPKRITVTKQMMQRLNNTLSNNNQNIKPTVEVLTSLPYNFNIDKDSNKLISIQNMLVNQMELKTYKNVVKKHESSKRD